MAIAAEKRKKRYGDKALYKCLKCGAVRYTVEYGIRQHLVTHRPKLPIKNWYLQDEISKHDYEIIGTDHGITEKMK